MAITAVANSNKSAFWKPGTVSKSVKCQWCSNAFFSLRVIFQWGRFVGWDGVSSGIQRRNPNALCLQPFIHVCCAYGRPRLCGELIGMEGNKLMFYISFLITSLSGSWTWKCERKVVWKLFHGKYEKKKFLKLNPHAAPFAMLAFI